MYIAGDATRGSAVRNTRRQYVSSRVLYDRLYSNDIAHQMKTVVRFTNNNCHTRYSLWVMMVDKFVGKMAERRTRGFDV